MKTPYENLVEYYFQQEFSDYSIKEAILRTTKVERKSKEYWEEKVRKVIELHRTTKKQPADAAAFISRLFKPRLKNLIKIAIALAMLSTACSPAPETDYTAASPELRTTVETYTSDTGQTKTVKTQSCKGCHWKCHE